MRLLKTTMAICGFAAMAASGAVAQETEWKKVDDALGRTAAISGDVHRYGFPRTDLQVTLDGVTIKPAFALGGWVAFTPMHGGAMIMGDLVLLETEVNPVMAKLLEDGVEVTAVHNHLLRASPATFYMHVGGHGDPVKIAQALHAALAVSKTPLGPPAAAPAASPAIDLDTAKLDEIIGVKGQANGGVYQFGVPRREPATEGGIAVTGPLGGANAINFQPTGGGKAAITGDFLVTAEEVNPLIKTLRANGIEVTAIHSHMLDEQPRMIFIHFWANDDAQKLARGLRAALDKTAAAKS
jgi:biotin operon repressor